MPNNLWLFFVCGLIPLFVGFVWYNERLFGKSWMNINGFTQEYLEKDNMPMIFGLAYLMSVIVSFGLSGIVNHQPAVFQMMMPDVMESGSAAEQQFNDLMATYGEYHRSWKHGAIHGVLITMFFVLPIIAINALFERRGWKYILIHAGYWLVTLSLIGAVLCQLLEY